MEKLFSVLDPAIAAQIKESVKQYARSGSGIQFELLEVNEKQLSIKTPTRHASDSGSSVY